MKATVLPCARPVSFIQSRPMRHFTQIIRDAGGPTALAKAVGEDPNTVHAWRRGDSIPAPRWNAVVSAGLATLQELADAAEARRAANDRDPSPSQEAA